MNKKNLFIIVAIIIFVASAAFVVINKPFDPLIISQPSGDFVCEDLYNEIENDLDRANFCKENSDCDVILLAGWYIDFGCYHFINKNVDKEQFYKKMEVYKQKCGDIINECSPAPEATCVSEKCIYLEKE